MSADNAIVVVKVSETEYRVFETMMPQLETEYPEESAALHHTIENSPRYASRADALVAAHDAVKREYIVEYGVLELTMDDLFA